MKLLELANEYYGYAVRAHRDALFRVIVDLGQSAIELIIKALILARGEQLPRIHGGYIQRFASIYGDVVERVHS